MKIKYENDLGRGPGFGRLVLSEFLAPDGPWQYSLQRASDGKYATINKDRPWIDGANLIEAKGEVDPEGNLVILLGPAVVDGLDPNETYKLMLRGEDKSENSGRFRSGSVVYSDAESLVTPEIEKTVEKIPERARQPEPEKKEPEKEPIKTSETLAGPEKDKTPEPVEEPENQEELVLQPAEKSGRRSLWYGAGTAAAILLLAIIWYMADRFSTNPDTEKPSAAASQASSAEKKALSTEERVKEFFADTNKTPEGASALASGLVAETPQEQDAVYRLYYYAAEKDDPQGMMGYARALDPSTPAWGTIKKDGDIALQTYARAAEKNVPGAAQAQDDLLKWLKNNENPTSRP